jgi:hypothetical protein
MAKTTCAHHCPHLLMLGASVSARRRLGNREFTSGACMTWRRAEALPRH